MANVKLKYPIYIPSKGRAGNQLTVKLLLENNIKNFYVIVEKDEHKEYEKELGMGRCLILPKSNYGTSSVARNVAIEHSKKMGYDKHWHLDDDINKVYEHNLGKIVHKDLVKILIAMEKEGAKHKNVAIVGMRTSASFLSQKSPEFTWNTSLTSFFLISNLQFRFNVKLPMCVDTDYLLQVLKGGKDILRINKYAFVYKTPMKQKGGYFNIYSDDKRRTEALNKFFSFHPEVTPGIKRSSAGFLHMAFVGKVWRKFKHKK